MAALTKSDLRCGLCGDPLTRIGDVEGCLDCGISREAGR